MGIFGRRDHQKDTDSQVPAESTNADNDLSPGWNAIAEHLSVVHAERKEHHLGTIIKYRLGGPDPLDGVSVFVLDDHWHYVSFGLTDLYGEQREGSVNPDESGWGFELTFRLQHSGITPALLEAQPPMWPIVLMQSLARYVIDTGAILRVNDHIDASNIIAESDAQYRAIALVLDPQLGTIATPSGSVDFRQLVLISDDELQACKTWNTRGVLDLIGRDNPLYVSSALATPERFGPDERSAVERGADTDGTSYSRIFADRMRLLGDLSDDGSEITLVVSQLVALEVQQLLRRRLPFDAPFWLVHEPHTVGIYPSSQGASSRAIDDDGDLVITLTTADALTLHERMNGTVDHFEVPGVPSVSIKVEPD
jgi:suppressor of fused